MERDYRDPSGSATVVTSVGFDIGHDSSLASTQCISVFTSVSCRKENQYVGKGYSF
jgi:hypothetical protein